MELGEYVAGSEPMRDFTASTVAKLASLVRPQVFWPYARRMKPASPQLVPQELRTLQKEISQQVLKKVDRAH